MAVPSDTPGAGDPGLPAVEAAAIDGATGDPYEIAQAAFLAQPPAEETPEADASDAEPGADGSDEDADSTATAENDADLDQYPEAVREKFKALDPDERKALYQEAEKRAEARIKANEEKTAKLATEAAEQETRRKEILSRTGQHVGAEAQTVTDANGNERVIPSLEDLLRLSQTRTGRDRLYAEYGMDEDATEQQIKVFEGNQQALDAAADVLSDQAWLKLDLNLRDGMRANGLDPDAILSTATSPTDVVGRIVQSITSKHEAAMSEQKALYEGRLEAVNANTEGMRGRVLAATSKKLATGGRSAGGGSKPTTVQQLIDEAGSPEAYAERAMRGDYAGLNLSK